ncbi:centrosomal protein of 70 kda [Anaeramoeba flamelloides]|uniref:Centrosomal protein of 70 kDa n=1 Tax=Anaeramoeba flamelloides TaxID=1746091 RepID=A0AAV8A7Z9_9EUKA|nr:centrosomal protein of 70 kda [Anaeramoeba flamelloides]
MSSYTSSNSKRNQQYNLNFGSVSEEELKILIGTPNEKEIYQKTKEEFGTNHQKKPQQRHKGYHEQNNLIFNKTKENKNRSGDNKKQRTRTRTRSRPKPKPKQRQNQRNKNYSSQQLEQLTLEFDKLDNEIKNTLLEFSDSGSINSIAGQGKEINESRKYVNQQMVNNQSKQFKLDQQTSQKNDYLKKTKKQKPKIREDSPNETDLEIGEINRVLISNGFNKIEKRKTNKNDGLEILLINKLKEVLYGYKGRVKELEIAKRQLIQINQHNKELKNEINSFTKRDKQINSKQQQQQEKKFEQQQQSSEKSFQAFDEINQTLTTFNESNKNTIKNLGKNVRKGFLQLNTTVTQSTQSIRNEHNQSSKILINKMDQISHQLNQVLQQQYISLNNNDNTFSNQRRQKKQQQQQQQQQQRQMHYQEEKEKHFINKSESESSDDMNNQYQDLNNRSRSHGNSHSYRNVNDNRNRSRSRNRNRNANNEVGFKKRDKKLKYKGIDNMLVKSLTWKNNYDIWNLTEEYCKQTLESICRSIEVKDISLILPTFTRLTTKVSNYTHLIEKIYKITNMYDSNLELEKLINNKDLIPIITNWKNNQKTLVDLLEFKENLNEELSMFLNYKNKLKSSFNKGKYGDIMNNGNLQLSLSQIIDLVSNLVKNSFNSNSSISNNNNNNNNNIQQREEEPNQTQDFTNSAKKKLKSFSPLKESKPTNNRTSTLSSTSTSMSALSLSQKRSNQKKYKNLNKYVDEKPDHFVHRFIIHFQKLFIVENIQDIFSVLNSVYSQIEQTKRMLKTLIRTLGLDPNSNFSNCLSRIHKLIYYEKLHYHQTRIN